MCDVRVKRENARVWTEGKDTTQKERNVRCYCHVQNTDNRRKEFKTIVKSWRLLCTIMCAGDSGELVSDWNGVIVGQKRTYHKVVVKRSESYSRN